MPRDSSLTGELVQADVKKIQQIADGGERCAPSQQMGSTGMKKRFRIPFDYLHVTADEHIRLDHYKTHSDEQSVTCVSFTTRAVDFPAGGITAKRVIINNL